MRKFIITGMALAMLAVPTAAMAAPADYTHTTGGNGQISVNKGVATVSVPTNSDWGVIKTFPTNLKVKDIKTLSFKSNSSAGGRMVYMNVITDVKDANGNTLALTRSSTPLSSRPPASLVSTFPSRVSVRGTRTTC